VFSPRNAWSKARVLVRRASLFNKSKGAAAAVEASVKSVKEE
jgi:hypothetical protein